ncbi:FecR family protein [Pseudoteredinibacter isoporae]|uniref:FecR family protein n=1 Tax=Pseudoteredinibacter isoporae TaxID=570281 RepID=UPI003102A810
MTPEHSGAINSALDPKLLDQAAYWIVRLRSDRCALSDKQRFSDWLETDPQHAEAFDQVLDTWQASAFASNPVERQTKQTTNAFSWQYLGAAAATVLMAAAVIFWQANPGNVYENSFSTARGEFAEIELPDGSSIELNTNSKLDVYFDDDSREISLHQGEAYFDINSDNERPLSVDLGDAEVNVIGTEFNIHKKDDSSHIVVTEGRIRVSEKTGHEQIAGSKALVSEGQQVNVFKRTGLGLVMPKQNSQTVNWRNKTLVFQETKLQQALEELNRYLIEPVDTSDESLRYSLVSGTFSLEEPDTTLAALIETFAIQQELTENGKTRLFIK